MSILKYRYLTLTHRRRIHTDPGTVCGSALSSHSLEVQSEPASDTESLRKAECSSETHTHTHTVSGFTLNIYFTGVFSLTTCKLWIINRVVKATATVTADRNLVGRIDALYW